MKPTPNPAPFRLSLGERGEMAACEFLRKKGYEILGENYKCKLGEIDSTARRDNRIVFIEIKTRTNLRFGMPQEAVDLKKQEKIFKIAQWYLKEKNSRKKLSFSMWLRSFGQKAERRNCAWSPIFRKTRQSLLILTRKECKIPCVL